jgi:protoporphyrinogen oxidase
MEKIAVIGGGISGLSVAHCLKNHFKVRVFETESRPGGLIKCDRVDGTLYHMVGGHVFNSRRQDVLEWFWKFFDKEQEFTKASRNAIISMEDQSLIGYPIENHAYMMKEEVMKSFIGDLLTIARSHGGSPSNFEEFLRGRFGDTLYTLYFQPYNEKIWRKDLRHVPLSWLEGKLPMPTVEEMIYNNFNHVKEMNMVHSSFYYAKHNGSQFLADRLAEGLDIVYNTPIMNLRKQGNKWFIEGEEYDKVIFCGNVKQLPGMLSAVLDFGLLSPAIEGLEFHGTTSVLCEIEHNPYSWIYMPSRTHQAHRIICTGNFSKTNNADGKMSGTIEFTDYISKEDIDKNLLSIPFSPKYIAHTYTPYTYPVQNESTRKMIHALKDSLQNENLFLLGRFAEWEYYNMDAAMGAAMDLSKMMLSENN